MRHFEDRELFSGFSTNKFVYSWVWGHTQLCIYQKKMHETIIMLMHGYLRSFLSAIAWAQWTLYADIHWRETLMPSPHLYQISVEYVYCHENMHVDEESGPIRRELWVLVPARKREEIIEAAWQRYIRSWLTFADLQTQELYYGLQALWPWLQQ